MAPVVQDSPKFHSLTPIKTNTPYTQSIFIASPFYTKEIWQANAMLLEEIGRGEILSAERDGLDAENVFYIKEGEVLDIYATVSGLRLMLISESSYLDWLKPASAMFHPCPRHVRTCPNITGQVQPIKVGDFLIYGLMIFDIVGYIISRIADIDWLPKITFLAIYYWPGTLCIRIFTARQTSLISGRICSSLTEVYHWYYDKGSLNIVFKI